MRSKQLHYITDMNAGRVVDAVSVDIASELIRCGGDVAAVANDGAGLQCVPGRMPSSLVRPQAGLCWTLPPATSIL
jgi:hypothetical protein